MTKAESFFAEEAQRCLKASPVIVLGSGASAPFGLPVMNELARCLTRSIKREKLGEEDKNMWDQMVKNLDKNGLEGTLSKLNLNECLLDEIIRCTWQCIDKKDMKVFHNIIADRNHLALSRLYRHLFDSTCRTLSVVTTNYDRLAEYAADAAGFCHYTGFEYGYFRQRQTGSRFSIFQNKQRVRMIDVWKVHGCLSWFMDTSDQVFAITSVGTIPGECRPAIVIPGIMKYKRTHLEPFRSIITGADGALEKANAYLCIGYGFNDEHIQPKLMERWQSGGALLVILAKELSQSARKMLGKAKGCDFLALEEADGGTRMLSHQHPDGVVLADVSFWNLPDFLCRTT